MNADHDAVTWEALRWLIGVFGAILLAAWGLLMKLIWGKVDKEQLKAHFAEDATRFDTLQNQIEQVEERHDDRHKENVERLTRIENLLMDRLPRKGN